MKGSWFGIKKTMCGMLALAAVMLCGCREGDTSPGASSYPPTAAAASGDTETEQTSVFAELAAVKLETPVLRYLGSYDLGADDSTQAARAMYLSTYAAEYFDKSTGRYFFPESGESIIISEYVSEQRVNDELSARIQSDDSPDLVDVRAESFPGMISRNVYEDISAYMNMSAPQWAQLDGIIGEYAAGAKRFYYPWRYEAAPQRLYYNRTLFEQYGIPDPAEQWAAGEWTWDALLSAVDTFTQALPGSVGICGDAPETGFMLSVGAPVIGREEDGKFVSNIGSESALRAVGWICDNLRSRGLVTSACEGYDKDSAMPAATGLAAFRAADSSEFSRYCRNYAEYDMWNVPYPADPEAGEAVYSVKTFGYLVPNGAKNIAGACCFINCCRLAEGAEPSQEEKTRVMKSMGYTAEEYEYMRQFSHAESFSVTVDHTAADPVAADAFAALLSELSENTEVSWQELSARDAAVFGHAAADLSALLE